MLRATETLFRGCLVLALAGGPPPLAAAQAGAARVERNAIELKQGMTLESVQKLLGKPKRTALKHSSAPAGERWQGTLEWSYTFGSEYSQRELQVVFAAKAPEEWTVDSWDWHPATSY